MKRLPHVIDRGDFDVRSVVLAESEYSGGGSATFPVRLPKGTLLRAFLPSSAARPCYLEGYSVLIRT